MKAHKYKELKEWVDGLDRETLKAIAMDCISELILTECLCFYDDTPVPYWPATGDRLGE